MSDDYLLDFEELDDDSDMETLPEIKGNPKQLDSRRKIEEYRERKQLQELLDF